MASRLRSPRGSKISFFAFQDIITSVTGILVLVTLILTLYLNRLPEPSDRSSAEAGAAANALAELTRQIRDVNRTNELRQLELALAAAAPDKDRLASDLEELRRQFSEAGQARAGLENERRRQEAREAERERTLGLTDLRELADQVRSEIAGIQRTNRTLEASLEKLEEASNHLVEELQKAQTQGNRLWLIPEPDRSGKSALLVTVSGAGLVAERFNRPDSRQAFQTPNPISNFQTILEGLQPERDYLVFYVRPSGIGLFRQCRELARQAGFEIGFDALEENRTVVFGSPQEP